MNAIVICNTKGGAGKTTISTMVVPAIYEDKEINIYEIDDNNVSKLKDSKLNFRSLKTAETENAVDEISLDIDLENENVINIIDAGGGNDTKVVLLALGRAGLEGLTYLVPVNDDLEQFRNAKETIDLIDENDPSANIYIIFNRAESSDPKSVKNQFINFFGSEKYGYEAKISDIEDRLEGYFVVKNNPIFGLAKNYYQKTLADMYPKAKELVENEREQRKEWAAKVRETSDKTPYMKNMALLRFSKDLVDEVETIRETFRVISEKGGE